MTEHEHEFDGPPDRGALRMCVDRHCTEWRVGTGTAWRELTSNEHTSLTLLQWEDLIMVEAMQVIHGKERGLARYRYLRHGGAPA